MMWPLTRQRWMPARGTPAEAATFARTVVAGCGPLGRDRAKNLLWAAGKLAGYGISLGLEPVPEVLLHPSVIERFTAHAPGLSGAARRTLRTNLRFIARQVVPHLDPADAPLPRERAKKPYTAREIAGFLALAGAQPTAARRAARRRPGLPGRRRRADPLRPAQRPRHRHLLPVRRRHRSGARRPGAAGGAGPGPLPRRRCWKQPRSPGRTSSPAATSPSGATSPTR